MVDLKFFISLLSILYTFISFINKGDKFLQTIYFLAFHIYLHHEKYTLELYNSLEQLPLCASTPA
jgi:hypothetical protein